MGLPALKFAPKDIAPEKYFGEWLPGEVAPWKPFLGVLGGLSATLSIRVTGAGGGEWSCAVNKDGLQVAPGLKDDAVVTIALSVKDFQTAVSGELKMGGPRGGGAKAPSPTELPKLIERNLAGLREVNGILRYQLTDPAAGDFVVDVKFAGPMKDQPDVTVSMGKDVAMEITKGELNPQAAFMAGQVQISGDISLLIQLMPLMMM